MKPTQNRRYFIHPDSQTNESIINLLRQSSEVVIQDDFICSDGKRRYLIEVTRDMLVLLRSEKQRSGIRYEGYRQIGEARPVKFDDASLELTVVKAARTRASKMKGKDRSEALAKLASTPGICLGSKIASHPD